MHFLGIGLVVLTGSGTRDAIRSDQFIRRAFGFDRVNVASFRVIYAILWGRARPAPLAQLRCQIYYAQMRPGDDVMKAVKRIIPNRCCGIIVDLQGFFLAQVDKRLRSRIKTNTSNFVRLLNHFQIPIVVTLERPVEFKRSLPKEIRKHLDNRACTFEKDFFDLCKEKPIRAHLSGLKRKQMIVAGCEIDVCVLQSCLGLLGLGFEVFVIEELIFSSSRNVDAAMARMKAAGAVLTTYKTLFYELIETVGGDRHSDKLVERLGPFPDDLPDSALL